MSAAAATIAALLATPAVIADSGPASLAGPEPETVAFAQPAVAPSRDEGSLVAIVTTSPGNADRGNMLTQGPGESGSNRADGTATPTGDDKRDQGKRKDILVEGEIGATPGDPLENVNMQTFEVVQAVDKALVEPVAHGYMAVFPKPVRDGIHNAVTNLDEPFAFLSFLLQFKPLQALKTLGRFVVNSTIGIAGLVDVAKRKPFNRPHIPNSFGHTLAFYGVGSGPFLYLPLIGSTTLRDLIGTLAQMPVLPLTIGKPFNDPLYIFPKAVVTGIDDRAQDDDRIQQFRAQSSNPYANYRSYYLRRRQAEVDVLKGLRKDAEVPMFDDMPPDIDDKTDAAGEGAVPDPAAPQADAGPQMQIDESVVLGE